MAAMSRPLAMLAGLAFLAACGDGALAPANRAAANAAAPAPRAPLGDLVRVRLDTDAGPIVLELDHRHAPITVENFVRYVDEHRFDGTSFYRASHPPGGHGTGFVQGGIQHNYTRMLPPIALEPTSRTGLLHRDGTISMARTSPNSAMGDFIICIGPQPAMDAGPRAPGDRLGYASFGRVAEGMDIVRRIHAMPVDANAGSGSMHGEMLVAPVRILSARREG
jgi:peptidyl-prolyl cis-trans isomerase A (cyclophilin A)